MKNYSLFLLLLLLSATMSSAQDFQYNFKTIEVNFSGVGTIAIREDSLGAVYSTAHWRSSGLREPAGYRSGTTMQATAQFEFVCAIAPDSISIRGIGNDTINLPMRTVALSAAGSIFECSYPLTAATKMFPNGVIDYYAPFTIRWEVSFDKGITWRYADSTEHKIYVTKAAPMVETGNFKYYHTVLELSCKNAKGQTTDTGIISHCWKEFTDQVVLNHKGDSLHYYKTFNTSNTNLPSLLRYRNAQCYTFAQLFAALIKIQGISKPNNYVYITPKATSSPCGGTINRFLVKNWNFGAKSDSSSCPSFPYRNTYSGIYISPSGYVFLSADVTDQMGVKGQCNANPSSFFNNHQIVKFDGLYYDACYGMTFTDLTDIKNTAFDGWGVQLAPNTYNFTTDMTRADLRESISTY